MIDRAEQCLRTRGFRTVRVRYHRGDLARLEVAADDVPRRCEPTLCEQVTAQLTALGFKFVTIDLQGFRSGRLNTHVALDAAPRAPRWWYSLASGGCQAPDFSRLIR